MKITHDVQNIDLTSGEIAELFNTYLNNSASIYVLSYFQEKCHDPDIASIIKQSLSISSFAIERITDIFQSSNYPVPKGFAAEDVNLNSSKLYSDVFMAMYVRAMSRFGLTNYSEARASCTRSDIRGFFNELIKLGLELLNNADEVLLSKGIFSKPPVIPKPKYIDYVEDQSFLAGFIAEKRPLNVSEINRIYLNFMRNSLGKALLTGFCQTNTNKDIHEYFLRGRELAANHMKIMGTFLDNDGLPIPPNIDQEVLDSTTPVFSDRLMLFHVVALDAIGLSANGITLARVTRRDLALSTTKLMAEVALYAEDGFNLLIKNKWFERIPENVKRNVLINE